MDIDTDDEEYKNAFGNIDEELEEAKREVNLDGGDEEYDDDEDEDEEEDGDFSRFNRKGRDKSLAKLFAAADKFSHILEGKESDEEEGKGDADGDGDSDEDESDGGGDERSKKRKGVKKWRKPGRRNKFVKRHSKRRK